MGCPPRVSISWGSTMAVVPCIWWCCYIQNSNITSIIKSVAGYAKNPSIQSSQSTKLSKRLSLSPKPSYMRGTMMNVCSHLFSKEVSELSLVPRPVCQQQQNKAVVLNGIKEE